MLWHYNLIDLFCLPFEHKSFKDFNLVKMFSALFFSCINLHDTHFTFYKIYLIETIFSLSCFQKHQHFCRPNGKSFAMLHSRKTPSIFWANIARWWQFAVESGLVFSGWSIYFNPFPKWDSISAKVHFLMSE